MPFESQAQRGFMFLKHPKIAKEFAAATPKGKKLPYKVNTSTAAGIHKGLMEGSHVRGSK